MNARDFDKMIDELKESCVEICTGNYYCDKCLEFDDVLEILRRYIIPDKDEELTTNPSYKEWSQEDFLKQRDKYKKDYQDFCERYEKERNEIRFRTLDRDTDNFS
ncbi:hypothetical protein [Kineothrix sp. MB12-C1]|uniref:hypothetical protein n=1 Tax=Kineothrix sp. MB12-C1 TaxID=3070215 RepID=UPI0027D26A10|nr:hypothetical protein [Kineothrix sp. MB12-C1]WMC92316.1 hypothetical protein RBB56_15930 [Kineothrix sp. MB12-C1]